MKASRLLLACCLAASLSACSPFGDDPLAEAQAAFEAQDYPAAQRLAQQALADDAGDAGALELLARVQLAMGLGEDAAMTLDRLDRSGADVPDAALLAAEAELLKQDGAAALELIGDAESAEAWRLRALVAAMQGDDAAAREAYASGRNADGPRAKLFASEATFMLDRGDLAGAGQAVALAQDVAPDRVETLYVAARLAEAQGDPRTALSNYLRIIEIAPLDRPALVAAVYTSQAAGLPDVTRHLVAYGVETRPQDFEFVYQQARIEGMDGSWEGVRVRMQPHEDEMANHDGARLLYAEAMLQLGQVETARALAAPVVARRAGDPEVMRVQAAIEAAS